MSSKKIELKHNISLKKYTSIRIGGEARSFFIAHDLSDLNYLIEKNSFSFYLLGKGSNLLIKDCVITKPILSLGKEFSYIREEGNFLNVGASTPLNFLLKYCLEKKLSGFEELSGVPASIGGLIAMNASSYGKSVSSLLEEVEVMDSKGKVTTLRKDEIKFSYRSSSLQSYIILSAKFSLGSNCSVRDKIKSFLSKRFSTQDFEHPSCGSVFKNFENYSAGFVIESCGLKGMSKGGAQVSNRHANFIINLGLAKYNDVDYLIRKIKDKVYKKHSLVLKEEVKIWN